MKLTSPLTLLIRAGTFVLIAALSGCLWTEAASAVQVDGVDSTTRKSAATLSTDGALHFYEASKGAGDRNEDSPNGKDYKSTSDEWTPLTVAYTGTGDKVIVPEPCLVRIVRGRISSDAGVLNTTTAGIIIVKDGSTAREARAAGVSIPAGVFYDGVGGARFVTNLTINFANAGDTGKLEVLYRPLDPLSTY